MEPLSTQGKGKCKTPAGNFPPISETYLLRLTDQQAYLNCKTSDNIDLPEKPSGWLKICE